MIIYWYRAGQFNGVRRKIKMHLLEDHICQCTMQIVASWGGGGGGGEQGAELIHAKFNSLNAPILWNYKSCNSA